MPTFQLDILDILGLCVSIISLFMPIVVLKMQVRNKSLKYKIVSENLQHNMITETKKNLLIYKDIEIRIRNSGILPIVPSDFYKNLTLSLNNDAKISLVEIRNKNPEALDVDIIEDYINKDRINILPTLINANDSFLIKVTVCNFDGTISLDGRITGVQNIAEDKDKIIVTTIAILVVSFVTSIIFDLQNWTALVLPLKMFSIGSLVILLTKVFIISQKNEYGVFTSLAGIVIILTMLLNYISKLLAY